MRFRFGGFQVYRVECRMQSAESATQSNWWHWDSCIIFLAFAFCVFLFLRSFEQFMLVRGFYQVSW